MFGTPIAAVSAPTLQINSSPPAGRLPTVTEQRKALAIQIIKAEQEKNFPLQADLFVQCAKLIDKNDLANHENLRAVFGLYLAAHQADPKNATAARESNERLATLKDLGIKV